ncbi:MAG: hypothetical protein AAGD38_10155 [Acidobacteriota bacterium]
MHPRRVTTPILCVVFLACAFTLHAQDQKFFSDGADEDKRVTFGFEAKVHYRDTDDVSFPVPFPPGDGPRFTLDSVDPGSHFELSVLTLFLDATIAPSVTAHAKVDVVDLYDRNPTSSDREVDVDEAWIRFGNEVEPGELPARGGGMYLKVGKMGKFERQDDRHLESYGLVSTAFNRMEDFGVEVGWDITRNVYLKATATQGNPVFLRNTTALAGDNGTPAVEAGRDPELATGFPILYDAEVEDLDTDGELEYGIGLGFRFGDANRAIDVLFWAYERELADTVDLEGTFYGGDLDLLLGPGNIFPFAVEGRDKRELGVNVWVYWDDLTLFAQAVDAELAGLDRFAWEVEASYAFDLPLVWAVGGQQLFSWIAPAARYSKLEPDYGFPQFTPSPSFAWEWEKIDLGLRLGVLDGVDFTAEYALDRFLRAGIWEERNEYLTTLRWRL